MITRRLILLMLISSLYCQKPRQIQVITDYTPTTTDICGAEYLTYIRTGTAAPADGATGGETLYVDDVFDFAVSYYVTGSTPALPTYTPGTDSTIAIQTGSTPSVKTVMTVTEGVFSSHVYNAVDEIDDDLDENDNVLISESKRFYRLRNHRVQYLKEENDVKRPYFIFNFDANCIGAETDDDEFTFPVMTFKVRFTKTDEDAKNLFEEAQDKSGTPSNLAIAWVNYDGDCEDTETASIFGGNTAGDTSMTTAVTICQLLQADYDYSDTGNVCKEYA